MQSEQFKTHALFAEIPQSVRESLGVFRSPFFSAPFFENLELSGSVGVKTGWEPCHITSTNLDSTLFLPGYLKQHSYGEYIFDWSIADAIENAGFQYYPKWVMQLPFTPIELPECFAPAELNDLTSFVKTLCLEKAILTAQLLYVPESWLSCLKDSGALIRHNIFFKWHNRGFGDFNDYVEILNRKRAKECRRERNKVYKADFQIERFTGDSINESLIKQFYPLYQRTYLLRSGHGGYLNYEFFLNWLTAIKDHVLIVTAQHSGRLIAAALFLFDSNTLYGRYWGSTDRDSGLHFECCFYQGMEFCIEHGLRYFNPGVQGEHKVRRGFEPYVSNSAYFYFNSSLANSIQAYFNQETRQLNEYLMYLKQKLPFKQPAAST